eukprot:1863670-Rhodomonas_salina.1
MLCLSARARRSEGGGRRAAEEGRALVWRESGVWRQRGCGESAEQEGGRGQVEKYLSSLAKCFRAELKQGLVWYERACQTRGGMPHCHLQ